MLCKTTTNGSLVAIIATGIFSFFPLNLAIAESAYNTPAVSGGQKCTKVGTAAKSKTGIQLVCTKEGNRLIWRKPKNKISWSDSQIAFGGYCGQSLTYSRRDKTYTEIQKIEIVKPDSSRAVIPLSYSRYSKNLLFQIYNCTTKATSLFTMNMSVKNATPSLVVALPAGQGISDAIIDLMSGTVIVLSYGGGLSGYVATQYSASGPIQIWSANNAGWFKNGLTFPSKLVASTGGQFFVVGSNSSSNTWRLDSVTKSGTTGFWNSQNLLSGSGSVVDAKLEDFLAVFTNENLFICKNFTSISIVNSNTCSVVSAANPPDGQRKIVWALDPKAGGRNSLWVSGNNFFVDPTSLITTPVNLTGCVFGCGMGLVQITEIDLDLLPNLKTWFTVDDISFR